MNNISITVIAGWFETSPFQNNPRRCRTQNGNNKSLVCIETSQLAQHVHLLVACLFISACHSFLENSVFIENQFFRLSCQSSFGATCTWKFDNQIIFDGNKFSSRFSKCQIFQNGSHCELTAAKTRLTYGGLYHCEIILDAVNETLHVCCPRYCSRWVYLFI